MGSCKRLAQLEDETATLRLKCADKDGELEEVKRRHDEQLERVKVEKEALRELVQRVEEAEERTYRLQTEAELEKFRVIAEETKKWEESEARWVRRIQELDSAATRSAWTATRSTPSDPTDASTSADSSSATPTYVDGTGISSGGGVSSAGGPGRRRVSFDIRVPDSAVAVRPDLTSDLSSDLVPVSVTMPCTAPVTTTTIVGFSGQPVVNHYLYTHLPLNPLLPLLV